MNDSRRKLSCCMLMLLLTVLSVACGKSTAPTEEPIVEEPIATETEVPEVEAFKIPLEGSFVPLDASATPHPMLYFIEFEDVAIMYNIQGNLLVIDLQSGEILYTEAIGNVQDFVGLSKCSYQEGYDYRLLFEERIFYRDSKDPEKQQVVDLNHGPYNSYDLYDNQLLWNVHQGGLMLMDLDTGQEKLLLPPEHFDADAYALIEHVVPDYPKVDYSKGYMYLTPRFICDGQKVVVELYSLAQAHAGYVIYDLVTERIQYGQSFPSHYGVEYPVRDHFVATGTGMHGFYLTDARSLETYDLFDWEHRDFSDWESRTPRFFTFDYENLLHVKYEDDKERTGFTMDLYHLSDWASPRKRLLATTDPTTVVYFLGDSEHYVLLYGQSGSEEWYCFSRYVE